MNDYDKVRRKVEPGDATPDVYAYLAAGRAVLLCGPCARRRGKSVRLSSVADKLYKDGSRCADCAPDKGENDGNKELEV